MTYYICSKLAIYTNDVTQYEKKIFLFMAEQLSKVTPPSIFDTFEKARTYQINQGINFGIFETTKSNSISATDIKSVTLHPLHCGGKKIENPLVQQDELLSSTMKAFRF